MPESMNEWRKERKRSSQRMEVMEAGYTREGGGKAG